MFSFYNAVHLRIFDGMHIANTTNCVRSFVRSRCDTALYIYRYIIASLLYGMGWGDVIYYFSAQVVCQGKYRDWSRKTVFTKLVSLILKSYEMREKHDLVTLFRSCAVIVGVGVC